jgi:hypothetical protein
MLLDARGDGIGEQSVAANNADACLVARSFDAED